MSNLTSHIYIFLKTYLKKDELLPLLERLRVDVSTSQNPIIVLVDSSVLYSSRSSKMKQKK